MEIAGKTVVVTGGDQGIGRALAETLRHEGPRQVMAADHAG